MNKDKNFRDLFVPQANFKGIRFDKIELYNWGGFNGYHVLDLQRRSSLLIGANNTGKSTVLDALKMVFVSNPKFNEAADTKDRKRSSDDRSLGSLVLGQHSSHSEQGSDVPVPDLCRSVRDISIVACTFSDSIGQAFTAMVLFHYPPSVSEVKVVVPRPLINYYIFPHGISLNSDVLVPLGEKSETVEFEFISRHLRSVGAIAYKTYSQYSIDLSTRLHLSPSALEQVVGTISTRSLDSIDDFIKNKALSLERRENLLEGLSDELNDIRRLNDLIIVSEKKRGLLNPIIEAGRKYDEYRSEVERVNVLDAGCDNWVNSRFFSIITKEKDRLYDSLDAFTSESKAIYEKIRQKTEEITKIQLQISENGGERLESLKKEVIFLQRKLVEVKSRFKSYNDNLKKLSLEVPSDNDDFVEMVNTLNNKKVELDTSMDENKNTIYSLIPCRDDCKNRIDSLESDFSSIRNSSSNIPPSLLKIRSYMEMKLGVSSGTFKFIGELVEVKEEECKDWEGPINNLLHSFALQLLVPLEYRKKVRDFLRNDMKGWVRDPRDAFIRFIPVKDTSAVNDPCVDSSSDSLCGKLTLKVGAPMTVFLRDRLLRTFQYQCVDNLEVFGEQKVDALEKSGLYMRRNDVNVKDDRRNIKDSSWYVLGFSNERKREYYLSEISQAREEFKGIDDEIKKLEDKNKEVNKLVSLCNVALGFKSWDTIDVLSTEKEFKARKKEYDDFSAANMNIGILQQKLAKANSELSGLEDKRSGVDKNIGRVNVLLDTLETRIDKFSIEPVSEEDSAFYMGLTKDFASGRDLLYDDEQSFREFTKKCLRKEIERVQKHFDGLAKQVIKYMNNYKNYYNDDSDLYPSIDCYANFEALFNRLIEEDLKMTKEIRMRFNTYVVDGLISFSEQLDNSVTRIYSEIDDLNKVLSKVYFQVFKGEEAFLHIRVEEKKGDATEEFRKKLKKTLNNVRFGKVSLEERHTEDIIDLITPLTAVSTSETDRKKNVTDVRNWFLFTLELINKDNKQLAYYKSSKSVSTGMQEAMAAFIMLVSLANIYGLLGNNNRNCFRLVMMDEVFRNNSNDRCSRVFKLLKELDFQLIFVTPEIKFGELLRCAQVIYQVYGNLPEDPPGHSYVQEHNIKEYIHLLEDDDSIDEDDEEENVLGSGFVAPVDES